MSYLSPSTYITNVLKSHLSQFLDLDPSELSIKNSFLEGRTTVNLKNVAIRPSALQQLLSSNSSSPPSTSSATQFTIATGAIGSLTFSIPWSCLTGSPSNDSDVQGGVIEDGMHVGGEILSEFAIEEIKAALDR